MILLQAMNDIPGKDWTPETLLLAAALCVIGLCITAWVFAKFFNAGKNTKYLRMQSHLLMRMAEKAGVSKEEIEGIILESFPPSDIVPQTKPFGYGGELK